MASVDAAVTAPKFDFRSSPESGPKSDIEPCPVRAMRHFPPGRWIGPRSSTSTKVFAETVMRCSLCEDGGCVCEIHLHKPSYGDHACTCAGAGMPSPWCNTTNDGRLRGCRKVLSPRSTKRWSTINDRRAQIH